MQWYTLLIYDSIEPLEILIKAETEDDAYKEARERWGPEYRIKFK